MAAILLGGVENRGDVSYKVHIFNYKTNATLGSNVEHGNGNIVHNTGLCT